MTSSAHLPTSAAALAFGQSRTARVAARTLRGADRLAPDLAARLAVRLFFTPFPLKLAARRRLPPEWRVQRHPDGPHGFALLRHRPSSLVAGRPRVLLVHGWAGDALQMRGLGEAVAAAGFEPVLMDLPAHGRSPGWRCTMPQIVASLRAAEACVGPFAGIVAHSMGALATLHAMASGLATPRVVALAPSSTPATVLRWFAETFGLPTAMRDRMRARIETAERMALAQFEAPWLGARVRAGVLLVHDRGDRLSPVANSEALAVALPGARLHLTEGLSHRRLLDDPHVAHLALVHLGADPTAPEAI